MVRGEKRGGLSRKDLSWNQGYCRACVQLCWGATPGQKPPGVELAMQSQSAQWGMVTIDLLQQI